MKKAPDRKHYLEFVTAALSIPVLLTVILINLNNLRETPKTEPTPSPSTPTREIIIRETEGGNSVTTAPTSSEICKKDIGPVSISYPKEGATLTENPVNFIIRYTDKSYCSVVWSYRINDGAWSEFSSNSPSIYNMPNGIIKFELRVQSTVSEDQEQLERNFIYQGTASPTSSPTPTPTVTP